MRIRKGNQSGFTLLEIITVVVIIAALACIAIPNYGTTLENGRKGEGLDILRSIREAQVMYEFEHGTYADSVNDLHITLPSNLEHFNQPSVASTDPVASIQRTGGDYTLSVSVNGTIGCSGTICPKLGYP